MTMPTGLPDGAELHSYTKSDKSTGYVIAKTVGDKKYILKQLLIAKLA